jgi:hypothetical protein
MGGKTNALLRLPYRQIQEIYGLSRIGSYLHVTRKLRHPGRVVKRSTVNYAPVADVVEYLSDEAAEHERCSVALRATIQQIQNEPRSVDR